MVGKGRCDRNRKPWGCRGPHQTGAVSQPPSLTNYRGVEGEYRLKGFVICCTRMKKLEKQVKERGFASCSSSLPSNVCFASSLVLSFVIVGLISPLFLTKQSRVFFILFGSFGAWVGSFVLLTKKKVCTLIFAMHFTE